MSRGDGIEGIHGIGEADEPPLCWCGRYYLHHGGHEADDSVCGFVYVHGSGYREVCTRTKREHPFPGHGNWHRLKEGSIADVEAILRPNLSTPEPDPVRTDGEAVWDLVMADMRERDQTGRAKYGTPLQAFNGRDALVDAYQEALDLVVYLRQAIAERDG